MTTDSILIVRPGPRQPYPGPNLGKRFRLVCTFHSMYPIQPHRSPELHRRLSLKSTPLRRASLHNHHVLEDWIFALFGEPACAIPTKGRLECDARRLLRGGPVLGGTAGDFVVVAGDEDVSAVGGASQVLAGFAVAKDLPC